MHIQLTNDPMYPISISDSWGKPVYIHLWTVQNDDDWNNFLNELNMARKKFLKGEKKMEKELKCPKCGSKKVIIEDVFDVISGKNNCIIEIFSGYCSDCDIEIQGEKVSQFIGYDEVEEV